MTLQIAMTPWQYLDGYADRIGELLVEGRFFACAGKWRVRRRLVVIEVHRRREQRRVAYELDPVDAAARRIAACCCRGR